MEEFWKFLSHPWTLTLIVFMAIFTTAFWMALNDTFTNRVMKRDNLGRFILTIISLGLAGVFVYFTILPFTPGVTAFFTNIAWSWTMLIGVGAVALAALIAWLKNR